MDYTLTRFNHQQILLIWISFSILEVGLSKSFGPRDPEPNLGFRVILPGVRKREP